MSGLYFLMHDLACGADACILISAGVGISSQQRPTMFYIKQRMFQSGLCCDLSSTTLFGKDDASGRAMACFNVLFPTSLRMKV